MLCVLIAVLLGANPAVDVLVPVGTVPVKSDAQRFQELLRPHAASVQTAPQAEPLERYVPGEVVVRFRPNTSEAAVSSFCERERVTVVRKGRFIDYHLLGLPADQSVEDAVSRFSSFSEVDFAEPNYIYRASWFPDDPDYWSHQWNLQRSYALDMQLAWELTTGSSSVIVAVLDEGVAYEDYAIPTHEVGEVYSPDGRYHRAPDLANTQFVQGYDCVNDDWHANDEGGHGTHVTGTIAQSTNNGIGVAGMAFGCRFMPVRVLGLANGSSQDVADGIAYAWQHGARVINMSLGSPDSSHVIHLAVIDAANAGALVVASSGNDTANHVGYPAAFPGCIAVGAVDYQQRRSYYSNWGTDLDVVAPGGDVRTQNYCPITQNTYAQAGATPPINVSTFDYKEWQGTSMAAPHVSALVAMMMSRGIRNPDEIKDRLYRSAIDLGDPGWDIVYGHGLIEPVAALGGLRSWLWYDDEQPDQYWCLTNGSERRFAVRFSPSISAPFNVTEGHVLVKDGGGRYNFRLSLNPASGGYPNMNTNLAGPVTFTTVGDANYAYWYIWDFGGVRRTDNSDFFLVFHWVPPNYGPPYVGGDTTNVSGRSRYYDESGWHSTTDYDWYLRTILLKDTLTVGIEEPTYSVAPVSPEGIICVRPQPARQSATISYTVARAGKAWVEVFDRAGRVVRALAAGQSSIGRHDLVWSGTDEGGEVVPSGVYFVQLTTNGSRYRTRVVLLK